MKAPFTSLLVLCLAALACNGLAPEADEVIVTPIPPSLPTYTPTPRAGSSSSYLKIGLTSDPVLDPVLAGGVESAFIVNQLFFGLTEIDRATGAVLPQLAEAWEVSDDGLEYTFHLRKDAAWSDGSPLLADDAVYAIRRALDPATGAFDAYLLYNIKNAQSVNELESASEQDLQAIGVERVDDFTVRFTLREPAAYFPSLLAMPVARPLPERIVGTYGAEWTSPMAILTSGPYHLGEWVHDDHLILTSKQEAAVEFVEFVILADLDLAGQEYLNGRVDLVLVPPDIFPQIRGDPSLLDAVQIINSTCAYLYGFNTSRPPFDDPQVRRAFVLAVDRAGLVERLYSGFYYPAFTLAPPGVFGSPADDPQFESLPYDVEQALGELAKAGYAPGGLPEITLLFHDNANHRQIAEFVAQDWREHLGAEVQLRGEADLGDFLEARNADAGNVFYYRVCADFLDEHNLLFELFHSTKGYNRIKWSNAEFDQLVERASRELEPVVRLDAYARAETILCTEQAAILPLFHYSHVYLSRPPLAPVLDIYSGLRDLDQWNR